MAEQKRCGTGVKCRFFQRDKRPGYTAGECRIGRPVFFRTADGDDDCGWPRVLAEDWCGEHKGAE